MAASRPTTRPSSGSSSSEPGSRCRLRYHSSPLSVQGRCGSGKRAGGNESVRRFTCPTCGSGQLQLSHLVSRGRRGVGEGKERGRRGEGEGKERGRSVLASAFPKCLSVRLEHTCALGCDVSIGGWV